MKISKKCKYCEKPFLVHKNSIRIYCSKKCRIRFNSEKNHLMNYPKNREKIKKRTLEYYHKNKDKVLPKQIEYKNKRYANDLEFHKKDNIRKGTAHRISLKGKICEKCGSNKDLHRHHEDYSKPLEIKILCRKCHNQIKPKEAVYNQFKQQL